MNLAEILAALVDITDPEERTARIDELLASSDVDLVALQEELANRAAELTVIDPADMTDEQITEAEIVAQLIAMVEDQFNGEDTDEEAAEEAADMEASAADGGTERAKAAQVKTTEALRDAQTKREEKAQASAAQTAKESEVDVTATETEPVGQAVDTATHAEAATEKEDIAVPESVAASGGGVPANRRISVPLSNVIPAPEADESHPNRVRHTVIAAGDLPGYRAGQELSTTGQIADAVMTGMNMVSRSQAPGLQQMLASIRREAPEHLTYSQESDWRKVDAATEQKHLPEGSLVAAGGWCAPSEVLYDVCPITVTNDGMIDLPTITANRGGIKYSGKPDFGSMFSNVGFFQTETDAIAGVSKPCYTIPCPDELLECRMQIAGVCLRQPILAERGWPEKVEEFVEYAMLAHAHQINARRIQRMVELANYHVEVPAPANPQEDSIFDPHGPGAFESVLSVLELQVEFFRYNGRLARNALLEAVAPYWLRGILRADISKKLGIDNRWGAGSDAALDQWFADRGVRIQWVYDWQDALSEQDSGGFGGMPPTQWPSQVQILLYETGAYFALQQDVITLTGIYDSVDLQKNMYTRLFTEEGWAVCRRCGRSMLLTLNLCPNGLSGGWQRTQCAPVAAA